MMHIWIIRYTLSNDAYLDILFQDTTGEFRPERHAEMVQLQEVNSSLLDKIKVSRIINTAQQIQYLSKTPPKRYSLIIIDSITDLCSFEYSKNNQYQTR